MKRSHTIWALLASFLVISIVCEAVENPNVPTSFKASNTVPSQGQKRRTVAQPVGNSNDVVTGNVGGGRHFRGFVPYGSTYYSGANLSDTGAASVNDFIRRSVNPIVSDRNPGQSRPYYQPSQATSSFRQKTGVTKSASSDMLMMTGRTDSSTYDLPPLPRSSMQISTETIQRPLSSNNQELDLILSRQFELNEAAKQQRRNELAEETTEDSDERDRGEFENFFDTLPQEPKKTDKPKQAIDEAETKPAAQPESDVPDTSREETEEALMEQKSSRTSLRQQRLNEEAEQMLSDQPQETPEETTDVNPTMPETLKTQLMEHAKSARIRGDHKTYESLAQAKFSAYMRAAEQYVIEGKYYKATDAYDLALVWASDDPRPYAGKAFSLFAAGEYMSSAYYLSRAIELNPQLAAKPVDIARLLGDRDIYETRLLEISTWQQRSGAGELAFLLAYLYHHDGKPDKAESSITTAAEAMPGSAAVKILQNIIAGPADGIK